MVEIDRRIEDGDIVDNLVVRAASVAIILLNLCDFCVLHHCNFTGFNEFRLIIIKRRGLIPAASGTSASFRLAGRITTSLIM